MATVIKRPNGFRRVQFYHPDGTRRTIYLGKIPQRGADTFKGKVEALVAAILTKTPLDNQTAAWVGKLQDAMYEKLVAVNLLPARKSATEVVELTLARFLDDFIETRKKGSNAKGTITNLGQTRRLLVEFFGTSPPLKTITPRRCDEWRIFLEGKGLATATISRHVKRAREFFRAALRDKLITENPMADVETGSQVNKSREYYITRAEIEKIIAA